MDFRLTQHELEIKHATKDEIIDTLKEVEHLLNFKTILPNPMATIPVESEEKVDESKPLKVLLGHNTFVDVPEVTPRPPYKTAPDIKKKLVFTRCEKCDKTYCTMINVQEDIAPITHCKCGHYQIAYDLAKGSYQCECGMKGFFLMTPDVNVINCKQCGKEQTMIKDDEFQEYFGYYD